MQDTDAWWDDSIDKICAKTTTTEFEDAEIMSIDMHTMKMQNQQSKTDVRSSMSHFTPETGTGTAANVR